MELVERLRADLTDAMKARDATRVRALRTLLAAIANAEAVPADAVPAPVHGAPADRPRRVLTADEVERVVAAEIDDRLDTITRLDGHDRHDEVAVLRAEIAVLRRYR